MTRQYNRESTQFFHPPLVLWIPTVDIPSFPPCEIIVIILHTKQQQTNEPNKDKQQTTATVRTVITRKGVACMYIFINLRRKVTFLGDVVPLFIV